MRKNKWSDNFLFAVNGFNAFALLYIACNNLIGTGDSPILGWFALTTFVATIWMVVLMSRMKANTDNRISKLLDDVMALNGKIIENNTKLFECNEELIKDNTRLIELLNVSNKPLEKNTKPIRPSGFLQPVDGPPGV